MYAAIGVREVLARGQRRRVDRLLQLALRDVEASDVDDEPCEPDQHDEGDRHQDERLTLLAAAPEDQEPRGSPQHDPNAHDSCIGGRRRGPEWVPAVAIFRTTAREKTQQGRQDSNLQPPVLETGALPVELRPWVDADCIRGLERPGTGGH